MNTDNYMMILLLEVKKKKNKWNLFFLMSSCAHHSLSLTFCHSRTDHWEIIPHHRALSLYACHSGCTESSTYCSVVYLSEVQWKYLHRSTLNKHYVAAATATNRIWFCWKHCTINCLDSQWQITTKRFSTSQLYYSENHGYVNNLKFLFNTVGKWLTRIFIVRVFPPQFFFSSIFCGEQEHSFTLSLSQH